MPSLPWRRAKLSLSSCFCRSPRSCVLEIADQLAGFNRQAAAAFKRGQGMPPFDQLESALCLLQTCASLGCRLQLSLSESLQLGAACQVVFETGHQALAALVTTTRAGLAAAPATPPTLQAALGSGGRAAQRAQQAQQDQELLSVLSHLAGMQLAAAGITMHDCLQPSSHRKAAAAFANSPTTKPAGVVAWLHTASEALLLAASGTGEASWGRAGGMKGREAGSLGAQENLRECCGGAN